MFTEYRPSLDSFERLLMSNNWHNNHDNGVKSLKNILDNDLGCADRGGTVVFSKEPRNHRLLPGIQFSNPASHCTLCLPSNQAFCNLGVATKLLAPATIFDFLPRTWFHLTTAVESSHLTQLCCVMGGADLLDQARTSNSIVHSSTVASLTPWSS